MLTRLLAALCIILGLALPAVADEAETAEFQRIIASQIAAFNADDGAAAFTHAAPLIQNMFGNPDAFMAMVKKGYQPVYRQQSYSFEAATGEMAGRPAQRVRILDARGKSWIALYAFEKQPDGTWKIAGCTLLEVPGADV